MDCSKSHALALSLLVLVPALIAQPSPRRPRGIHAFVIVELQIDQQQRANPSITTAGLHSHFQELYTSLLNNPAVSGLALGVQWSRLNPNPPSSSQPYDWSWLDDGFSSVAAWNSRNPAQAPKTIQALIPAGFNSPQWVMDQIPSCDGLFMSPPQTPASNCGKATFQGYKEGGSSSVLPMPWNAFYKSSFQTFLTAFAAQYGANPALVSINVSGPTAASSEMIMPNNANTPNQSQFGGITPENMWLKLLAFAYPGRPAYQKSDQAFIDEWNAAIDMYGRVFSGLTLDISTGNGLINFSSTGFTVPSAFTADCPNPDMDCAAETTILSHFVDPSVATADAKATGEAGVKGRIPGVPPGNLGVYAANLLAQRTAQFTSPSAQILAGHQFATSFSHTKYATLDEGCTVKFPGYGDTPAGCAISCTASSCPAACVPQACLAPGVTQADLAKYNLLNEVSAQDLISPEQALYNVLRNYFNGTPAAASFGGTAGTEPQNYLQIYFEDFQYAAENAGNRAMVVQTGGTMESVTAQALLNLASQKLLAISEPALLPAITPGGIVPGTIEPGEWVSIYGTNLASGTATWQGDFPASLAGTSVTINGKAAYLSYASPGQINIQAPNDTAAGAVPVVVMTAAGSATSTVTLVPFSPSFFLLDSKHVAGIILRSDGSGAYGGGSYDIIGPTGTSLGYPTVAAKAGDVIELFGTGFGPTNPAVPAGTPFSGAAPTTSPVSLRINNVSITPTFTGLSGAGLYQLNVTVPSGLGTGDVSLQASVGGVQTPSGVVISLQ